MAWVTTMPCRGNVEATGYYRVAYTPELFAILTQHLTSFHEADRLNLLQDTWALVTAGRAPITTYLDLVQALHAETSPTILESIAGTLRQIDFLERGTDGRTCFQEWARGFLGPRLAALGPNTDNGAGNHLGHPINGFRAPVADAPLTAMLRGNLIGLLGDFGDPDVQHEARLYWEKFLKDPASLTGDLRRAVILVVARDADDATYEKLHELAKRETSTEQKRLLYGALARSLNPKHADQSLALSLTEELVRNPRPISSAPWRRMASKRSARGPSRRRISMCCWPRPAPCNQTATSPACSPPSPTPPAPMNWRLLPKRSCGRRRNTKWPKAPTRFVFTPS